MWRKLDHTVALMSEASGRVAAWIIVVLITATCYEIIARYAFNAPTTWSYTLSFMLGGCIFTLGQAHVTRNRGHIRVDLIYARLQPKTQLLLDSVFDIAFLLPVLVILTRYLWADAVQAYRTGEFFMYSVWYPITWPYKTILAIGFTLFLLEALVTTTYDVAGLHNARKGTHSK